MCSFEYTTKQFWYSYILWLYRIIVGDLEHVESILFASESQRSMDQSFWNGLKLAWNHIWYTFYKCVYIYMCIFALPTGQHVWFSLPPGGNLGYGQEAMADCLMTQCNFQSCRFPFLEDTVGLMVTPRVGSLPRIHRENRGQNGDLMR